MRSSCISFFTRRKKIMSANKQLKSAREARGLTQAALAQLLGVEEQTVRSWERRTRTPGAETQRKLSRFFDLTPEQLGFQPKSLLPGQEVIVPPHNHAPPLHPSPIIEGNRHRMLSRVRSRWIEGVLNNSLYLATLITLGLREQPDAVENPWRLVVQESHLPSRLLPVGTRLTEVYDTYGGALLILGEPGAGKTTLLLDLAKDLLERASFDETHLIPTVFNLSSWTEKRLSLPNGS
jgi:transcriptional regulator with XRE-family HTH domain